MRLRARVDTPQREIVAALRQYGCSVQHLHQVGRGCPDLLVGFRGANYLLEVKPPGSPSRRRLTPDEAPWHSAWRGQVAVVQTIEEALAIIATDAQEDTERGQRDQ